MERIAVPFLFPPSIPSSRSIVTLLRTITMEIRTSSFGAHLMEWLRPSLFMFPSALTLFSFLLSSLTIIWAFSVRLMNPLSCHLLPVILLGFLFLLFAMAASITQINVFLPLLLFLFCLLLLPLLPLSLIPILDLLLILAPLLPHLPSLPLLPLPLSLLRLPYLFLPLPLLFLYLLRVLVVLLCRTLQHGRMVNSQKVKIQEFISPCS